MKSLELLKFLDNECKKIDLKDPAKFKKYRKEYKAEFIKMKKWNEDLAKEYTYERWCSGIRLYTLHRWWYSVNYDSSRINDEDEENHKMLLLSKPERIEIDFEKKEMKFFPSNSNLYHLMLIK